MGALVVARVSYAAQRDKVARIVFLSPITPQGLIQHLEAFRAGLRGLGYIEGKNIVIEYRWVEGDYARLPKLAAELVQLKPDVIVTHSQRGFRALKQASETIPIVMASGGALVETGLVKSLARPGGNITGSTILNTEVSVKRLEILRDAVPHAQRVAILRYQPATLAAPAWRRMERGANALKLTLRFFDVRSAGEIESAFADMTKAGAQALVVSETPALNMDAERIAQLAAKARLPSIGIVNYAPAGGLLGYGVAGSLRLSTRR
jgi:putative ABC transport system substrate-binding protein